MTRSHFFNAIAMWPDGDFSFMDGIRPPQELVLVPLAVESILALTAQGGQAPAMRHSGQSPAAIALRPDTVLTFTDIPDSGYVVEISREEWMVLAQIDGANPLGAIAVALQMEARILVEIAHVCWIAACSNQSVCQHPPTTDLTP